MRWHGRRSNVRIRDYHRRSITNPFFRRQHTPKRSFGWLKIVPLVLAVALIGYLTIYAPFVRVARVQVAGTTTIDPSHVAASGKQLISGYRYGVLPKDHLLMLDRDGIRSTIIAMYGLSDANVSRSYRSLVVEVEERTASFRLIDPNMSYLVDQNGSILRAAQPGEGEELVALMRADASVEPTVGEKIFDTSIIKFLGELHKHFATQVGIREKLFRIDMAAGTVTVVAVEDWEAIFDPMLDLNTQLTTLSSAIVSKFGPTERAKLLYVDVRYGDRVFYKWK